jgi:hypothetical protein
MLTDPKLRSQVDALWDTPSRRFCRTSRRFGRRMESRGKNLRDGETFGTFLAGNYAISR